MYLCHNDACSKQFPEPILNYTTLIDGVAKTITSTNEKEFNGIEYVNSGESWHSCPHCGSDDISNLDF